MAKDKYEGMFLFPGSANAEESVKRVRDLIEKQGGTVLVAKKWDERKLAYEIKKQKRGLFVIAYFTGPGAAIAPITRDVNLSDDILRVLITDASHLSQEEMERVEPQPIVVAPPREDRGFGFDGGSRGDRGPRGPRREEEAANA
ncbi:MAG: 30S ribosomal protein S6 [Tepidisphaeraceae bacterium]